MFLLTAHLIVITFQRDKMNTPVTRAYYITRLECLGFVKTICTTILLLTYSCFLSAEQKQSFDQFDIHYSVVNSTFISTDIAKIYNIIRGKDRAFVNIAIRKQMADGTNIAQKAIVKGISSDLMRDMPLEFVEIIEQNAIYYIAEFRFYDEEIRNFTIDIQPNPNRPAYKLKFTKTLYRDK